MWNELRNNVLENKPLIHNITNYVTVNDVANIELACGASPIMADAVEEVEDITTICNVLNINIGTNNNRTFKAMLKAGQKANDLNHPIVLDPVGVGASSFRNLIVKDLIENIDFKVIKGNISEIKSIITNSRSTQGVDANIDDEVTDKNIKATISMLNEASKSLKTIIVVTGKLDIVVYKDEVALIRNGHSAMASITGTGCMLSGLISAFVAANKGKEFQATCAAVMMMGICGELAYKRLSTLDGSASYRTYLIDAISNFENKYFKEMGQIEFF